MAKNRTKRRNGKEGFTLPVAILAGFVPLGAKLWNARGGGMTEIARQASRSLFGFDGSDNTFSFKWMGNGLLPIIGGALIHKLVGQRMGVNAMLRRSGVPLLRL